MHNHTNSPWFDSHSYPDIATDLTQMMDQPMNVLGHSIKNKAAIVLAIQRPDLVHKLIMANIAPVTYTHDQHGPIATMQRIQLSAVTSKTKAKTQLSNLEPEVANFLLQSLNMKNKYWQLNLNMLQSEIDKIISFPQLNKQFDRPTFFLSKTKSDYVTTAYRTPIKALFPNAVFAKIPNAEH